MMFCRLCGYSAFVTIDPEPRMKSDLVSHFMTVQKRSPLEHSKFGSQEAIVSAKSLINIHRCRYLYALFGGIVLSKIQLALGCIVCGLEVYRCLRSDSP